MNDIKLDRLSALLEGLAPVVTLGLSAEGRLQGARNRDGESALQLFFLTRGSGELKAGGSSQKVDAPALVAVQASQPFVLHRFTAKDPHRLIAAHVQLTGPVAPLFLEEFTQPRTVTLDDDEPALRLAVAIIESELSAPRCGQPALSTVRVTSFSLGSCAIWWHTPSSTGEACSMAWPIPASPERLWQCTSAPRSLGGWNFLLMRQECQGQPSPPSSIKRCGAHQGNIWRPFVWQSPNAP
ncbi:MAG: hypothetical protein ACKOE3_05155 [Betaproteobacteria bacterium]